MSTVTKIAASLLVLALCHLVEAAAARQIWQWFLSGYGPGPGLGPWFGIISLVDLVVSRTHVRAASSREETKKFWEATTAWGIVGRGISSSVNVGLSLATTFAIGWLFHWIS